MPKLKTNRGAAKRFHVTAGGIKHRSSLRNHKLTNKSHKRKRHLRTGGTLVAEVDQPAIERLLNG